MQQLPAERRVGDVFGQRRVLVGEEVAELGLILFADRVLERDRRLRAPHDLLDLRAREVEIDRDLDRRRVAAQLAAKPPLGADDLVVLVDDVDGHANRAALVGDRARDGLADPPRRIRRELVAAAPVELLGGADEADRPLLDEIEERQPLVAVALRNRDDEAEVRLDHLLLRAQVARSIRFASSTSWAAVRSRRLPMSLRKSWSASVDICCVDSSSSGAAGDDLDVQLVERPVEVIDLGRLEVELVESECDFVGTDAARGLYGVEQGANVLVREDVRDRRVLSPCVPPASDAAMCLTRAPGAMGRSAQLCLLASQCLEEKARLPRVDGRWLLGDGEAELRLPLRDLASPEEQHTEVETHDRSVRESPESGPRTGNGAFGSPERTRDRGRHERLGRVRSEPRGGVELAAVAETRCSRSPRADACDEGCPRLRGDGGGRDDDRRQARRDARVERVERVDGIRRVGELRAVCCQALAASAFRPAW